MSRISVRHLCSAAPPASRLAQSGDYLPQVIAGYMDQSCQSHKQDESLNALTAADRISEGQRLKNEATALLRTQTDSKRASVLFKRCFAYTRGLLPQYSELVQYAMAVGQNDTLIDEEQEASVRALELACNQGLATIYLRSGHHERALRYSEEVGLPHLIITYSLDRTDSWRTWN